MSLASSREVSGNHKVVLKNIGSQGAKVRIEQKTETPSPEVPKIEVHFNFNGTVQNCSFHCDK